MIYVKVKKLADDVEIPAFATKGSACFDFRAATDAVLSPGQLTKIGTGLAMEIPQGYSLDIYPRSGRAFKQLTRLVNCVAVIDSDYRDEIMIGLFVESGPDAKEVHIKAGERIAQGRLVPVFDVHFDEVESLENSDRSGGLGSTGNQ